MMTGIMILFYFAGLLDNTANSSLLDLVLNPENLQSSSLKTKIVATGAFIIGLSVLSLFFTGNVELGAYAPIALYLLTLLWDFIAVVITIASVSRVIAVIIFGPIMFLFYITIAEWLGKRD